jgi:hypothetical protein
MIAVVSSRKVLGGFPLEWVCERAVNVGGDEGWFLGTSELGNS